MKKKLQWSKVVITGFLSVGLILTLCSNDVLAQERTIKGTVLHNPLMNDCHREVPCFDAIELTKDEDWIPTPGAVNIMVKSTGLVAKTDREGNYEITVPSRNDTLLFMYLAHNRIEVPIDGREVVDVQLTPTPLPVIDRLLKVIMPKVIEGEYPDLDEVAEQAQVNRATARAMVWLVLGNRRMGQHYPGEFIPDYSYDE